MAFYAFGGAEAEGGTADAGVYHEIHLSSSIVAAPALAGTYSYAADPQNANVVNEVYGWAAGLWEPSLLIVQFMFRLDATFDASISIAELGPRNLGGAYARRIALNTDEALIIADETDDAIGQTANAYIAVDTNYWMVWYVDLRVEARSRDILWVFPDGGSWDKAVDVFGHGDGDYTNIDAINFGTKVGKGLPTVGGPFYVDEMCVQVLNELPNAGPIGSVTTRFKVPSGNGTDGDFNTGTGDNPDFEDVDEIPPDDDTTYDEGDVAGDQQSYAINDATAGDTPLAVQVIGLGSEPAGAISLKTYILEGGTRDDGTTWDAPGGYLQLNGSWEQTTYNRINGKTITESLFNSLEAGVELTAVGGGGTFRLTQIGLEYIVDGPKRLPADFPVGDLSGVALGSDNPGIY